MTFFLSGLFLSSASSKSRTKWTHSSAGIKTIANGETYHYVDPHWNQYGNDLVGQTIADYIGDHTDKDG